MKNKILWLLIVIGAAFQLLTVVRSGQGCDLGICFWGPNGHDGVWHLALGQQASKQIPPPNPVFSGTYLKSYHWGYDFLLGLMSKVTPFTVSQLNFQVLPLIFSLLLGILSYVLGKRLSGNRAVGLCFVLLNYFANSLGWVINLIRNGSIGGESLFWSMQSASFLLNPPFALSVIVLFLGYYLWHRWQTNLNWGRIIVLGLIFGTLLNVKAYAGILFLLAGGVTVVLKNKKIKYKNIFVFIIAAGIYALSWYFWHRGGEFPFIFKPLWFIRTMYEAKDRLFIPKFGRMWWILSDGWLFNPRFWVIAGLGVLAFIIGNFNLRLLGIKQVENSVWEINWAGLVIFGTIIPLIFVQTGTTWNTIQFLYYGLIFSNYFLAKFLSKVWKDKKIFGLIILLILLIGNMETLKTYLSKNPSTYIPKKEIKALAFLAKKVEDTVLAYPYQPGFKSKSKPPLPLYVYESTAYVSAYSGKQQFIADRMNLNITGYDWKSRLKEKKQFFKTYDKIWARGFLINNKIDYIYLVDDQKLPLSNQELGVKKIYDRKKVKIYKVLK